MTPADRAPDGKRILSVSGLLETARSVLEMDVGSVWVEAEVFEYRGPHRGSGHSYFKLRDADSTLSAILWRGVAARALQCELQEGQKVLVRGRFDIYAARGTLSFVLDHVEDRGSGDLAARFEQLRRSLQEEGLFDPERKQAIPERVRQVVLITGRDSAAEADVLHVFEGERHPVHVLVRHARVQGEGAMFDIIKGLEEAASIGPDLILLSRGGGSLEDLWAFNEESLVRAIAACPIPVMSAVGHEVDFTLCDFVADARAITPTAGAQAIIAPWVEGVENLASLGWRLGQQGKRLCQPARQALRHQADPVAAMSRYLQSQRSRFEKLTRRLLAQAPEQKVARQMLRCRHAEQRLMAAMEGGLHRRRAQLTGESRALFGASPKAGLRLLQARLDKASARLQAGNPEGLLERGYALVSLAQEEGAKASKSKKAKFLRDPQDAPEGSKLRIQLAKGELDARVE